MSRLKTAVVSVSTLLVALLLVGAMLGKTPTDDGAYRQLAVYTEVLSRIKSDYVEEPDLKSVTLGALNGMLESIDPFASYLNADQYKEYLKHRDGYKGSVGLVLSKRFGAVGVVDAIPGSPAEKAGLSTGDLIESIKGIATRDMPLAYAELLLQGDPGTTVEVSVLSVRNPEAKKLTLTRTEVRYPDITAKLLPDGVGHIHVQTMKTGTSGEVTSAVKSLEKQGAKRLILDFRHSASGHLDEGIAVANLFLDKGQITYMKGQRVPRQSWDADSTKQISKLPMVVITNRGTAGGAEIAAAALLDNKRAEVVGERTYGNASLRQSVAMDDGGAIILSVAKYYSPAGKAIQDTGVVPTVPMIEYDTPVDIDEEAEPQVAPPPQTAPPAPETKGEDQLLKKAIEVLNKGAQSAGTQATPPASDPAKPDPKPAQDIITPEKPIK
ncbi:MAG TPA: S41 family peptidase [Bryobacteraceae bacterium]|nr:S41 family peptidase [Bryobacteraceae bacterium]